MKTIKFKTLALTIITASCLITSCKKGDTGPAGATGANGTNSGITTSTDGYIKGTLSGTRQDGTAFNETFDFENYWGSPSGTLDSTSATTYDFSIVRAVDASRNNSANLTVTTTSPTASSGRISLNNFSYTKSLGTNKEFVFTLSAGVSATITSLSYNPSTGLFTGNFAFNTISGAQNSTGNTASIIGSFQATVTQLYYLKQHISGNKKLITQ